MLHRKLLICYRTCANGLYAIGWTSSQCWTLTVRSRGLEYWDLRPKHDLHSMFAMVSEVLNGDAVSFMSTGLSYLKDGIFGIRSPHVRNCTKVQHGDASLYLLAVSGVQFLISPSFHEE